MPENQISQDILKIIDAFKKEFSNEPNMSFKVSEEVYNELIKNKPVKIKWTKKDSIFWWLFIHCNWFRKRHSPKGNSFQEVFGFEKP